MDTVPDLKGRKNVCIFGNVIALQIIPRNEKPEIITCSNTNFMLHVIQNVGNVRRCHYEHYCIQQRIYAIKSGELEKLNSDLYKIKKSVDSWASMVMFSPKHLRKV